MSYRDKIRKFKSEVRSLLVSGPGRAIDSSRSPSPVPSSPNVATSAVIPDAETTGVDDLAHPSLLTGATSMGQEARQVGTNSHRIGPTVNESWACLRQFFKVLDSNTRSLGPIREAVGGLIECIRVFETVSKQRNEYKMLHDELEAIFKQLLAYCSPTSPPAMTTTLEGLCKSIQQEISYVQEKQSRGRTRKYVEAEGDVDEVLACYRRVQGYLQRVALNMNISMWRTVDNIAVNNQLDRMSPSLSAHYRSAQAIELKRECRDVSRIIPSIAYQIARFSRPFRYALSRVLEKDPDVYTRLPHVQFETLISQTLIEVKNTLPDILVVVIDGLDECENKESTSQMLDALLTRSSNLPVKFVVSSRPEPEIRDEMTKQTDLDKSRMVLHELDRDDVQADIETYLRAALARIQPSEDHIATLVRQAGVLFIYAATVVRYIGYNNFRGNCHARLQNILSTSSVAEKKNREIDELYSTILRTALENPDLETSDITYIRQVLHTVICAREPLTITLLAQFLRVDDANRARAALEPLWSVLHISGSRELVTTLHASFPEYMLDSSRSVEYHCDPLVCHQAIAVHCFDYFRDMRPQFNVCNLKSSFIPDDEVVGLEGRAKGAISEGVFYSARYWASHLYVTTTSPTLTEQLEEFLSMRLLLWMEVMNLKNCKGSMPGMIRLAEKCNRTFLADLRDLIHDAWRFTIIFSSSPVSRSTPHIYTSMLPFWPNLSPITKLYTRKARGMVELEGSAMTRSQRALLAVWHYDSQSLAFSPDGSQIAVRTEEGVVLLDASTGHVVLPQFQVLHFETLVNILYPDKHPVHFSHDGSLIVSTAKRDWSGFCIWSAQSGKLLSTGEMDRISSIASSPNGTRIAFGLTSGVNVLDSSTGKHLKTLITREIVPLNGVQNQTRDAMEEDHQRRILQVKYSADGCYLVACDSHGEIIKWDDKGGEVLRSRCWYEDGHDFESVDISPDCTYLAAGCGNNIYIWRIGTCQAMLGRLQVTPNLDPADYGNGPIECISYSSGGVYLASGSDNGTICIWDALTGCSLLRLLEAHTETVASVCFSPDGAYIVSSAHDQTIRLWDIRSTQLAYDPLPGHIAPVTSARFSPGGNRIVACSQDRNVCVWDAENGELVLQPIWSSHKGDGSKLIPPLSAAFSPHDTLILALVYDGMRKSFLTKNSLLHPIHRPSALNPATLSEGNIRLLSTLSMHGAQVLASSASDNVLLIHPPIEDNFDHVAAGMVLNDSRGYHNGGWMVQTYGYLAIYDACGGHLLSELHDGEYIDACLELFQLSPDGTRIARVVEFAIVISDMRSGEIVLGPLEGNSEEITSIHWSSDGSHIVSGACDNTICLWDARTGRRVLGPIKWHTNQVESVMLSSDSTLVVSGSSDKTIRVTDVRGWANIPLDCNSLAPTGSDWELGDDGWAIDNQGRLLAWVPPELRTALMYPRTRLLISTNGWIRMNFSSASLGESWIECYQLK